MLPFNNYFKLKITVLMANQIVFNCFQVFFFLILQESYNRTKKVLIKNKEKVTKLAEGLMKYETLDMEEIKLIVEGKEVVRT